MTGCKARCRISWRLFLCKKNIWKISFVIRGTSAHQAEEKLVIVFFWSLFWMFCWNFRWFFLFVAPTNDRSAYGSIDRLVILEFQSFGIVCSSIASKLRHSTSVTHSFLFHSATFVRRIIFRRCDRFLLLPHIFYSVAVATI